ncbi:hypothetical protein SAMN06295909_1848 [Plantibacter sp. VKM Ac-1784]|jgi:hypothetical protein|uniref:Uncharacterized protein n=1 Tax=Plantibacter elymi (nom. nud.) TaxID=199708 RepID=A0ABY1REK9_9MICO|nr:hypothetical protein [Plantibacter sp. VKM Ac-1784]SMQ67756.1 hypothetical protein SAMN06295909_1848 [Plantibacter sp. VKM Ac-1784]
MDLNENFVSSARMHDFEVPRGDRTFTFSRSDAISGNQVAELVVLDEDRQPIGYIVPYTRDEHGAIESRFFGVGMPSVFRTVEDALEYIAPSV